MFKWNVVIILVLAGVLLPCFCSAVEKVEAEQDENLIDTDLNDRRDPRQLSFITTPFRRAASTTRDIVRFIRDYSTGRFANGTHTEPQTYIGKRAAAVIQRVTLSNIRDAVNYIIESPVAPVVTGLIKNIDRDTLQLLSPSAGASILARLNSTTPSPSSKNRTRTSGNSTTTAPVVGGKGVEGTGGSNITTPITTLATLVVENIPTIKSNVIPVNVKSKVVEPLAVDNEDDEDDSSEDD